MHHAAISSKFLNVSPMLTETQCAVSLLLSWHHGICNASQILQRRVMRQPDHLSFMRNDTMSNTLAPTVEFSSTPAGTSAPAVTPTVDIQALFREHQLHLLHFVRRYLQNSADAEDVVQNTFMEAIRCAERFSGLSKPSTWLFGIALNLARNQVRRNCSDLLESADETFMNQVPDYHADPAKLVETRQIVNKVDALLKELPPKIRITFDAVLDADATYEEAAEQLCIPIGTVRSRVSRVRTSIRAELG